MGAAMGGNLPGHTRHLTNYTDDRPTGSLDAALASTGSLGVVLCYSPSLGALTRDAEAEPH